MEEIKNYPPYLDHAKPRKQQTNADRIRAMNDRELAEYLSGILISQSCLRLKEDGYEPTATQIGEIEHRLYYTWMTWLQQPAEDE